MTIGLVVDLHDPSGSAPQGWAEWVAKSRQPPSWDWPIVRAVAAGRPGVLAATVRDGTQLRGLLTGRFVGARRRGGDHLAGVLDLDSLVSSAVPGYVFEPDCGENLLPETMAALRRALRERYGARVTALMVRQVSAAQLPSVSWGASVIREGGPIAVFRNEYDDFDGYLADLGRGRRRNQRRVLRDYSANEEVIVSFTAPGDPPGPLTVPEMQRLHDMVLARNHRRTALGRRRRLIPTLSQAQLEHPGVERLTYHDASGQLLAYSLIWNHDLAPVLGSWGMLGIDQGGPRSAWFHHVALTLRWAIESGRPMVLSGKGSIADKVDLGYEVERQWTVLTPLGRTGSRKGAGAVTHRTA